MGGKSTFGQARFPWMLMLACDFLGISGQLATGDILTEFTNLNPPTTSALRFR